MKLKLFLSKHNINNNIDLNKPFKYNLNNSLLLDKSYLSDVIINSYVNNVLDKQLDFSVL